MKMNGHAGPRFGSSFCLFLDVDGTLLEMTYPPSDVFVDPALRDLLLRVRDSLGGAMALVSGRSLAEVDRLFDSQDWPVAGLHGIERRDASGHLQLAVAHQPTLHDARPEMSALAERIPGVIMEDKGLSVAMHYRGAPDAEARVRRTVGQIAQRLGDGFVVQEGRMVLELRPRGATKGDAVRAFLGEEPFRGRRPIYIGDDFTDETAFAEVERVGGISVAVGDHVQAMVRASSPGDVRAFLEDLVESRAFAD